MHKIKFLLIAVLSVAILGLGVWGVGEVVAFGADDVAVLGADSEILSSDYLDFYAIPSAMLSATNNGGELRNYELSRAFDRNFSTSFKSAQDNNVSYTNPETGETATDFINYIDVSFASPVTINRLLYGSEAGISRGYPTILNLYYKNGSEWVLIKSYESQATESLVVFDFGQNITLTQFRFEYKKVYNRHKYVATAREIIFLQPETVSYSQYKNIFTDYAETVLSSDFNSLEKIENFCQSVSANVNFVRENAKILRAKQVINGTKTFDSNREFSTGTTGKNKIEQYGNLESYARNDLKLSKFGTNRQVIGLLAKAGEEITIYVDGDTDDPLPKIRFSQHKGSWQSWLGSELQLFLGKNTFTAPDFYREASYSQGVVSGGAIYLVNPYTTEEQSDQVKVYIEGGSFYPVYGTGVSESEYLTFLSEYAEQVKQNPTTMVNLTEIVSDHVIATVNATTASEKYESYSPQTSVEGWNGFMDKLLEFGGIPQTSADPLFNQNNLRLRVNIRTTQPWAGSFMFAAGEHIGVGDGSQSLLIYGSGFGWGVTHEIGHMLDINSRTVSETSNNMWAKFNETAIENVRIHGNFSQTLNALTNDLTYCDQPYFVTYEQNYLVWWYLEAWQNGYWGGLENCYRGLNLKLKAFYNANPTMQTVASSLTKTELQVFYSSIITGVDLGYYFERWGFSISNSSSDPIFKRATAGEAYNTIMGVARSGEYVDDSREYKLWYQNSSQYKVLNTTPIYSETSQVSLMDVTKTADGYLLEMFSATNQNHLGFEIWEGSDGTGYKVIGFTYSNTYLDGTQYSENYVPNYKIVAVDNTFNTTALSESKNIYWDKIKIEFVVGEERTIKYVDPNTVVDLPTVWRENVKLLGWLHDNAFYGCGAVVLASEHLTFTASYKPLYKFEVVKDGECLYKEYYEYGTEIDIRELGLPDVDKWLVGDKRIKSKISITGDVEMVAWNSLESAFVQIITFSSIFIYVIIAVVAVIFSWCDKKSMVCQKADERARRK